MEQGSRIKRDSFNENNVSNMNMIDNYQSNTTHRKNN
jgi:hypothetical protein